MSKINISDIFLHTDIKPIHIDANIEDVLETAMEQNFVPVVDDENVFIGIIKRSDIIKYFYEKSLKEVNRIA